MKINKNVNSRPKFINYLSIIVLIVATMVMTTACSNGGGGSNTPTVTFDTANGGIANGATNVSTTPSIVLQFSTPVDPATVNSDTIKFDPSASITIVANNDNTIFSITVNSPLEENTKYTINVSGVKTISGQTMSGEFSFTTGDFTAPTVAILSPSNGATGVSIIPTIQVQFSEAVESVNSTTVTLHLESATGTAVAIGNITSGANNTYTFSPSSSLVESTQYVIVLSSGIKDSSNNALTQTEFSFTTGNSIWSNVGIAGFSAGTATHQSLAINSAGIPYVAYRDQANGNKTTVMKFADESWVAVGEAGFSAGEADYQSLAIASNGTPYVAYQDVANNYKATVMKFNGSSWVNVGEAGFSTGETFSLSIAIDSNGTPYVAYSDRGENNSYKTTVMKFNGSSWVNVGAAEFSAGPAGDQRLAITSNGTPYVSYRDGANSHKVTVMKFNGSSWVAVGDAGFSPEPAISQSLALNSSGDPYVVYSGATGPGGGGGTGKVTATKFNGESWVDVGAAEFSAGATSYLSLAINSSGLPYVAYRDQANSNKATVMKFNGTSWIDVGVAGFSAGGASYQSLAIDSYGIPYVAYSDAANSGKTTVMKFE